MQSTESKERERESKAEIRTVLKMKSFGDIDVEVIWSSKWKQSLHSQELMQAL